MSKTISNLIPVLQLGIPGRYSAVFSDDGQVDADHNVMLIVVYGMNRNLLQFWHVLHSRNARALPLLVHCSSRPSDGGLRINSNGLRASTVNADTLNFIVCLFLF